MAFEIRYSQQPLNHPSHTHVYYELLYVLEGEVAMTIRGREHRVEAGSLVFLSPFDAHATRMLSPVYRRYYLLIPPDRLRAFHNDVALLSVFRFHGEHFSCVLPTGGEKGRFDAYFALLLDAAQRGGPDFETRVEALMTLILVDARAIGPELFLPPEALSFLPIQEISLITDRSKKAGRCSDTDDNKKRCRTYSQLIGQRQGKRKSQCSSGIISYQLSKQIGDNK